MNWVLYSAPLDLDAIEFRILTIIADNVDVDGRGFGKSVKTLMELYRAPISERTMRAKLDHLQQIGVLRLGDQRLVSYLPGNRRPKVYDIVMTTNRGAENAPLEDTDAIGSNPDPTIETTPAGDHIDDEQGCNRGATGVQLACNRGAAMVADKYIKSTKNIKNLERVRARENKTDNDDPTARLIAFIPDDTHRLLAEQTRQNLEYELDKYRDACLANGRIPIDPAAGFRNWLRRPAEHGYTPAQPPTGPNTPTADELDTRANRILDTSTILRNLIPDPAERAKYRPAVKQALAEGVAAPEIVDMIARTVRDMPVGAGA